MTNCREVFVTEGHMCCSVSLMTLCFPKLCPQPVVVDRILAEPVAPETLMVAFADVPATMPALVWMVIDALPPKDGYGWLNIQIIRIRIRLKW